MSTGSLDLSRPPRPPRPKSPAIPPLGAGDLVFSPVPTPFAALTASLLGNAAAESDGFDAELLAVAQDLAGEGDGFAALDQDLAAAAFTPGEFEAAVTGPLASDVGALLQAGQQIIDDLGPLGALDNLGGASSPPADPTTLELPPATAPVLTVTSPGRPARS